MIKGALRWNKKHSSSFFKGLSVAKKSLRPEGAPLNSLVGN